MSDDITAITTRKFELPHHYGREILRSEVGSTLHGTGLPGHEDYDEMGIFLERPRTTIGLGHIEHYTTRSKPDGERSEAGDTDLVIYSARKWSRLALNGNPSVLLLLFSPDDKLTRTSEEGHYLRNHAYWFASKRAGKAFLGYMQRQRMRMTGERGRAGRVRVMEDGAIDWKYAMHMIRLGLQGVEYLQTGTITLPIIDDHGDHLRAIRRGDVKLDLVLKWAEKLEVQLKRLLDGDSPLPDRPEEEKVEQWLIKAHLDWWGLEAMRGGYAPVPTNNNGGTMDGEHETTSEGPAENKVDDGATDERKTEDPSTQEQSDVRGEISDPVEAPGPTFGGDQPDGTNENTVNVEGDAVVNQGTEPDGAPERPEPPTEE